MSKTVTISRFSLNGFESHFQSHLKNKAMVSLDEILSKCPTEYMKKLIKDSFVQPDPLFEFDGIFAFIGKATSKNKRFYLNHLKTTDNLSYFEAEISVDAICYVDDGVVYSSKNRITISEAFDKKYDAIFIPKNQLKYLLQN